MLRTWAFCDGSRPGALQPRAGQLDESVFRALDSVLAQARARNIRLLLTLTNNWQDYGAARCVCARLARLWRRYWCRLRAHKQASALTALTVCPPGGMAEYVSWAQSSGEQLWHKEGAP